MSIRYMVAAWEARGLSPKEKLVLLKLADNANDDGECWPSKAHIIRHTGLSEASVKRALRDLRDRGLLSVETRWRETGEMASNLFKLDFMRGVTQTPPRGHMDPTPGGHTDPLTVNKPTPNKPKTQCGKPHDARFDDFWTEWPKDRRRDKKKAREAWKRKKLDGRADEIIADVKKRISEDGQWIRGFVPLPTTYLNGERWEDTYEPVDANAGIDEIGKRVWDELLAVLPKGNAAKLEWAERQTPETREAIRAAGGIGHLGMISYHDLRSARGQFLDQLRKQNDANTC